MIILDASFATKLVIREAISEAARAWYSDAADETAAPDLIAIEVAQAIVRRVNARETPLDSGRRALRAWRDILDAGGITLIRSEPAQIASAAELAMALGHPVKDCLYLALAIERGATLVTCDARFHARVAPRFPMVEVFAPDP